MSTRLVRARRAALVAAVVSAVCSASPAGAEEGALGLFEAHGDVGLPRRNDGPEYTPDGRGVAFLSFGKDVDPSDHPYYKQVYVRLMPIEGGAPRVVAYVYGGQGTLNVPSWSPDGTMLAFVSNTDME